MNTAATHYAIIDNALQVVHAIGSSEHNAIKDYEEASRTKWDSEDRGSARVVRATERLVRWVRLHGGAHLKWHLDNGVVDLRDDTALAWNTAVADALAMGVISAEDRIRMANNEGPTTAEDLRCLADILEGSSEQWGVPDSADLLGAPYAVQLAKRAELEFLRGTADGMEEKAALAAVAEEARADAETTSRGPL